MKEKGIKCNLIVLQNFFEFQKITQGVEVKRKAKKTGRIHWEQTNNKFNNILSFTLNAIVLMLEVESKS